MKAKLIILGSGHSAGTPLINGDWGICNKKNLKNLRTRCSAIILKGKNSVLIDTSPDIKNQLLKNKIKNLSSVIYTHEHADQTNGLFELRPFYWKTKNRINVYGNSKTIKHLKKAYTFLFNNTDSYYEKRRLKIKEVNWRSKLNHFSFHLSNPFTIFFRNFSPGTY